MTVIAYSLPHNWTGVIIGWYYSTRMSFYQIRSPECTKYAMVLNFWTGQEYRATKWPHWKIQTSIFLFVCLFVSFEFVFVF